jgi:hypothetical protein
MVRIYGFIYPDIKFKLSGESQLLQLEVILDDAGFIADGGVFLRGSLEDVPDQFGEFRQVRCGFGGFLVDHVMMDAGEGVEDEMRVHLGAEELLLKDQAVLFFPQPALADQGNGEQDDQGD